MKAISQVRTFAGPFVLCLFITFSLLPCSASAQEDMSEFIEKKNIELMQKEEALKKEEVRLKTLGKDIDNRIAEYRKLLDEVEEALGKIEVNRKKNMKHLVKTYEAMPPEEAAAKLSVLDEKTAAGILKGMSSRKAGAAMAAMDTEKAASLTMQMTSPVKNFPVR